jgi:hypothetical protein
VAAALAAGGCGSSDERSAPGDGTRVSAETRSAATGDIPDNQVFLVFRNRPGGYSIKYPEGWTQVGSGRDVTFKDKDNLVHVAVASGPAPTVGAASDELAKLKRSNRALIVTGEPKRLRVGGNTTIRSGYSTRGVPNPVTGKRVTLLVDRYQVATNGKTATIDLGTPKGVDNVDAYRLMIESFNWR